MVMSGTNGDDLVLLRLITYNKRLVEARKEKGFTQKDMYSLTGIYVPRISQIETLRDYPTEHEADEIAAALGKDKDWLFPEDLIKFKDVPRLKTLTSEQVTTLSWVRHSLLPAPEPVLDKDVLNKVLKKLPLRERAVIIVRFGLIDGYCRTLNQTAEVFHVTQERIRQIQAKALRKLRHPRLSRQLKDYLK